MQQVINITEATGPVVTKFNVELSGAEGTKICSKGPDCMTNMAAMPVLVVSKKKTLKIFLDCLNNELGLTLTVIMARSNMGKG